MTEKRWLYFALGVTTAISIGAVTNQLVPLAPATGLELSDSGITFPDGTVQTTAVLRDPRRLFYLSDLSDGRDADSACDAGFHFASLWEILDVSNLRYDSGRGADVWADSGQGPPIYKWGWVRTGGWADASNDLGEANCKSLLTESPWTSNASNLYGTCAALPPYASIETLDRPEPWDISVSACNEYLHSWCVEDYPGAGNCLPEATADRCQDGIDNDCDSYVDCVDWDCGPFCS